MEGKFFHGKYTIRANDPDVDQNFTHQLIAGCDLKP